MFEELIVLVEVLDGVGVVGAWTLHELVEVVRLALLGLLAYMIGSGDQNWVRQPWTTRDLLNIATNHASGEEAVRAVFSGSRDRGKAKCKGQGEGPSTQRGKKNKKDQRRPANPALVTVADRVGKQG